MKEKRRFTHWAHLNDEGKKEWGDIFPEGDVPVLSMVPQVLSLGGKAQRAFMVYIPELTDEQFESIIARISNKFNAPKALIRKDFLESGLPLRYSLTSGSGTNHPGLFF